MAATVSMPAYAQQVEQSFEVRQADALIAYHRKLADALDETAVSPITWPALLMMTSRPSVPLDEIALALRMPETTSLRLMKTLQEDGLMTRSSGRTLGYSITDAGEAIVAQVLKRLA